MAPTVDEYLAQFDAGIDAHPNFVVKAAVVRMISNTHSSAQIQEQVGTHFDVDSVLTAPRTSWVPEVHANAIYLGCRHAAFDSDDGFVAHAYDLNRKILSSPLYRGLKYLFTKERIVKLGSKAFGQMHRGLEIKTHSVEKRIEDGGEWDLISPPNLSPKMIVSCYATSLLCAAEIAGLDNLRSSVDVLSPTISRIRISRVDSDA